MIRPHVIAIQQPRNIKHSIVLHTEIRIIRKRSTRGPMFIGTYPFLFPSSINQVCNHSSAAPCILQRAFLVTGICLVHAYTQAQRRFIGTGHEERGTYQVMLQLNQSSVSKSEFVGWLADDESSRAVNPVVGRGRSSRLPSR